MVYQISMIINKYIRTAGKFNLSFFEFSVKLSVVPALLQLVQTTCNIHSGDSLMVSRLENRCKVLDIADLVKATRAQKNELTEAGADSQQQNRNIFSMYHRTHV